jgi:hypothetical protein
MSSINLFPVPSNCNSFFYGRVTPFEGQKGIREHNCIVAFLKNIFAALGICSRVVRYETNGKIFYLNKISCIKWINQGISTHLSDSITDQEMLSQFELAYKQIYKKLNPDKIDHIAKDVISVETPQSSVQKLVEPPHSEPTQISSAIDPPVLQTPASLPPQKSINELAREAALKIHASESIIPDASPLVEAIIQYFKDNPTKIHPVVEAAKKELETLYEGMKNAYTEGQLENAGQASKNRQFLIQPGDWKIELYKPETILALLALEALWQPYYDKLTESNQITKQAKALGHTIAAARLLGTNKTLREDLEKLKMEYEKVGRNYLCEFSSQATRDQRLVTIGGVLRYALRDHPVILETVSLNTSSYKETYLEAYLRKKKTIFSQLEPLLSSVAKAYEAIGNPTKVSMKPSHLCQPYEIAKWKDGTYKRKFEELLKTIRSEDSSPFDKLIDKNQSTRLWGEFCHGFGNMIIDAASEKYQIFNFELLNFDQVVDLLTHTEDYLRSHTAHLVFDCAHFSVGLKTSAKHLDLSFKDRSATHLEIFSAVIDKITEQGVNLENSIAAEQLYVRIMWLLDWCDSAG